MRGPRPLGGSVWPFVNLVITTGCSVFASVALAACLMAPKLRSEPLVVVASVGLVLICAAGVGASLRQAHRPRNG